MKSRLALSRLLTLHAAITFAAGAVLIVAPGLIPSTVGITLDPRAYLLAYLLAAAELGFAALSFFGAKLTDAGALRVIVLACVVFHTSSAALEVYAFARGTSAAVWGNVVARALIVALLLHYAPAAREPAPSPPHGKARGSPRVP